MELNKLKGEINQFEKKAGFDRTKSEKLLNMIDEEIKLMRKNIKNKKFMNGKITDILILSIQLANRFQTKFSSEIKIWFKKSEKYLK